MNRVVGVLKDWFSQDQKSRSKKGMGTGLLELSDAAAARLEQYLKDGFRSLRKEMKSSGEKLESVQGELEDLERLLTSAPEESELTEITNRLMKDNRRHAAAETCVGRLESDIEELTRKREMVKTRLNRLLEKKLGVQNQNEDGARIAELARQTTTTMQKFLVRATEHKIEKLAQSITDAFLFLIRKEEMIQRVEIDPSTFSISLIGPDGKPFAKGQLSEGEKQLFAIAVLWGLARTSGRPLPAIIDTPMARLDSEHRAHLVERYFPHASHQVILLSTDTEVDRAYYPQLKEHIARSYELDFHAKERFTRIKEGYFWE